MGMGMGSGLPEAPAAEVLDAVASLLAENLLAIFPGQSVLSAVALPKVHSLLLWLPKRASVPLGRL